MATAIWRIYHVRSPIGEFIGIARDISEAATHWGTRSDIRELETHEDVVKHLINIRADGKHERVFIAV